MKAMVEELMGVIGGRARHAKTDKKKAKRKETAAARQVPAMPSKASAPVARSARQPKKNDRTPEQVIPLESEDFKDF
jgi:hypothetical protein